MSANGYDVEAIRRDFPILSREVYGKPLIYLDNGASAQKPQTMIDAVTKAYGHEYANVHRGLHYLSNTATDNYEAARETVRKFLNAGSVDEIIFTRSTTEAINLVAYSLGLDGIGEGDEIVDLVVDAAGECFVHGHRLIARSDAWQGADWREIDDCGEGR